MKKGLIIGIIAVAACCAVAFGVHHEMRRTAQMRAAVDSALVQNRNYVPFTSDSTLREVAAYFDHPLHFWITANDRMREKAEALRCRRYESIVNEKYDFFDI